MTEIVRSSCHMCGGAVSPAFSAYDENRRVDDLLHAYVKCAACGMIALESPPADLGRYYQSAYYQIPDMARLNALAAKDRKLDLVRRYIERGALLEIGPAFGVFAWRAKQHGFDVSAIEMDDSCCDFLNRSLGIPTTKSDRPHDALRAMPPQDVIVAWHVIEHLLDPVALVEAAARNLKPGGYLVFATPNPQAAQFTIMGRHWPHVDAPRHTFLIPYAALARQANAFGLIQAGLWFSDPDGRSWNRFGWQRILMNRFRSLWMQRLMFLAGTLISIPMAAIDMLPGRGAAYTIVLQKPAEKTP